MNFLQKLVNRAISILKTKELLYCKDDDKFKISFEQDLIKLLKKHKIFDSSKTALQKVEIIVESQTYPIIKLTTLLIDKN